MEPKFKHLNQGVWAAVLAALLFFSPALAQAGELTLTLGKKPVYIEPAEGLRTCAEQGGTDCGTLTDCQNWTPASDTDTCCLGGCGASPEGRVSGSAFGVTNFLTYDQDGFTYYLTDQIAHLNYLGMGFHRLAGSKSPRWPNVQPTESAGYDFSAFDPKCQRLISEGHAELMATITASVDWDQDQCHPDRQGAMYPCNVAAYEDYLRAVVERYDGDEDYGCSQPSPDCYQLGDGQYPTWPPEERPSIKYWQLENELDAVCFWDDTAANYAQLLELTNNIIKGICPDCKIVMPGQSSQYFETRDYEMSPFYQEVFDNLSGQYFDVIDNHLYKKKGDYNVYRGRHDEYVAYLAAKGFTDVDYWITEMGTFSGTPSLELGYQSEEDDATELVKRFAYSFASGVKKVCWWTILERYLFNDTCNRFNFVGLINNPLAPEDCSDPDNPTGSGLTNKKLSYYTLKLLIEELAGADWGSIEIIRETDNVYVYRFTAAGRPVYVAWWDWFNDVGEGRTINLDLPDIPTGFVRITEAVPNALSGGDLQDDAYPLFFDSVQVPLPAPPYVPSAPSPADGAPGVELVHPVLSWSGGDPNPGDTVTYDFYFGQSETPRLKRSGLTESTFALGKLCCDTPYYWQVVARDDQGEISTGPVWSFTTTDQGCPVIESFDPNPCAPLDVVSILGRNFGTTRGPIFLGKRKIKPGSRSILSWTDTKIDFRIPSYKRWPSGTTKTRQVKIKAGPAGSRLKSNKMVLTITKP